MKYVVSRRTMNCLATRMRPILEGAWRLIGIYLVWITLHYVGSWIYAYWCAPWGITGFVVSPFYVTAPHCTALRWCITRGAETIIGMWVIIGSWLATRLLIRK